MRAVLTSALVLSVIFFMGVTYMVTKNGCVLTTTPSFVNNWCQLPWTERPNNGVVKFADFAPGGYVIGTDPNRVWYPDNGAPTVKLPPATNSR